MLTYELNQWKSARWRRGERFYRCDVRQDLFGTWVLVKEWGGIISGNWGKKETVCEGYAEAEALFEAVAKRREKRDYVLVKSG
jgi:hypothetical protein